MSLGRSINLKNAIKQKNTQKALEILGMGLINFGQVFENGNNLLMLACANKLSEVALAFIQTGQSKPEHVNQSGDTALILACRTSLSDVALALIQTGHSKPEQVNEDGDTALIIACNQSLNNVALALIQTGQSKPEQVNLVDDTALIIACRNSLSHVALALIETGQSKPEQVDNDDGDTALIIACRNSLSDVALALIETGQSNPAHVNIANNTALTLAQQNRLNDVEAALIRILPGETQDPNQLRETQRRTQEEAVRRAQQAAQNNIGNISNYEDCIICGEPLDNTDGPGTSDKCREKCNDVVKVCENNHMFHRGCILQACNVESIDVASQMGFSQFSTLQPQARRATCPICTKPLNPTCEELVTSPKVSNKDLPLKSTGGKKRRTKKRRTKKRKTNKRRTKKRKYNKK
jgi:ankyrin repeat protein